MTEKSKLEEVILRAREDPTFRGQLIWFPEKVVEEYQLDEAEARAARTGDMTAVQLSDTIREMAGWVYDLHDLRAGE